MSLLLQEIVRKTRLTSYQEFCDTLDYNLNNLNKDEKMKLEQDQIKIIREFKTQAIFQIACLQRRLLTISRELCTIQQNDHLQNHETQIKLNDSEETNNDNGKIINDTEEEIIDERIIFNDKNTEQSNEQERKIDGKKIYSNKVLKKINLSNSQDLSQVKIKRLNKDQMNMTYSNFSPKRNVKMSKKINSSRQSSDLSKSSSSSLSFSREEIKHMEKNSDIYHQKIAKLDRDNGSRVMSVSSQRSVSMKQRKRMERLVHNFKEEVKSIGNHYPKNKKIKS